jgi:hypothetical protein
MQQRILAKSKVLVKRRRDQHLGPRPPSWSATESLRAARGFRSGKQHKPMCAQSMAWNSERFDELSLLGKAMLLSIL